MASINMSIRTDSELKAQAEQVLSQLGMNMTGTINMFLQQIVRDRAVPLSLSLSSEQSLYADLLKARTEREQGVEYLAEQLNVGVPTLTDIAAELLKPGRDPRDELPPPLLRTDVMEMKDLKPGMKLKGTVRNVIDFGAFVDIGVHQDGLVHISQMANRRIRHPLDVVRVGDVVTVWVLSVDLQKKRISLTMKSPEDQQP